MADLEIGLVDKSVCLVCTIFGLDLQYHIN